MIKEVDAQDFEKKEVKTLELKVYSKPEIMKLGAMQKITLLSSAVGTEDSDGYHRND